jgi:hypothetical protein
MSSNLRYPNIKGQSDSAKLAQVQSYLHQLVDDLNYALKTIETGSTGTAAGASTTSSKKEATPQDAKATFSSIKSLIIKSADIVNAYYDEINHRLSGVYVAESDFGVYAEETDLQIEANSKSIEQHYTDIQQILSDIDGFENALLKVNANISTGLLYYGEDGVPVYGMEIGQRTEVDGVEVFNKYARFTSDRLSFFDQNGNEVAYISDKKLYISHIEVTGSYNIGDLVDTALADGSVVTRYVVNGGE